MINNFYRWKFINPTGLLVIRDDVNVPDPRKKFNYALNRKVELVMVAEAGRIGRVLPMMLNTDVFFGVIFLLPARIFIINLREHHIDRKISLKKGLQPQCVIYDNCFFIFRTRNFISDNRIFFI
jgi:hypothetical protein